MKDFLKIDGQIKMKNLDQLIGVDKEGKAKYSHLLLSSTDLEHTKPYSRYSALLPPEYFYEIKTKTEDTSKSEEPKTTKTEKANLSEEENYKLYWGIIKNSNDEKEFNEAMDERNKKIVVMSDKKDEQIINPKGEKKEEQTTNSANKNAISLPYHSLKASTELDTWYVC